MKRRPLILFDVDGPLTGGFVDATCEVLRDLGVTHAHPAGVSDWDIMRGFGVEPRTRAIAYDILRRPGVAESFTPRDGARQMLDELRAWADVVAITSPLGESPTWVYGRDLWLREHLGFDARSIIHTSAKHLVPGDALVEDKTATLIEWEARWPDGLGVLWAESYNANDGWSPRVETIAELKTWLERALR